MRLEPDGAPTPGGSADTRTRSRARRIGLILAITGAIATIGCASIRGSEADGTGSEAGIVAPTPEVASRAGIAPVQIRAEIRDRRTGEPLPTISIPVHSEVELVVDGDPAATVHLIGYNRYTAAENGRGVLRFVADRAGRFLVERDETGVSLVEVEVFDPDIS